MADILSLFPDRAAIGRVDARTGAVYMTPEFTRALATLSVRVGGARANSLDEVAIDVATHASAAGLALTRKMAELDAQLAQAVQLTARLAELRKHVAALEAQLVNVPMPTDWEHPGAIGARTANSGQFTTINRVKITAPVGTATLTLVDGKTFKVSNTLTLTSTDGVSLNIGNGGTLGTAAYANTGAFAARTATALANVATDAATTQALANSLRSVLLSVGIGS